MPAASHKQGPSEAASRQEETQALLRAAGLDGAPFALLEKKCSSMNVAFSNPGMKVVAIDKGELEAKARRRSSAGGGEVWFAYMGNRVDPGSASEKMSSSLSRQDMALRIHDLLIKDTIAADAGKKIGNAAKKRRSLALTEGRATLAESYMRDSFNAAAGRAVMESVRAWWQGGMPRLDELTARLENDDAHDDCYPGLFGDVPFERSFRSSNSFPEPPEFIFGSEPTWSTEDNEAWVKVMTPDAEGLGGWQSVSVVTNDLRSALEIDAMSKAINLWARIRVGFEMVRWVAQTIGYTDPRSAKLVSAAIKDAVLGAAAITGASMSKRMASEISADIVSQHWQQSARSDDENIASAGVMP
ncbi:hypothetical protein [Alcanivorax sp. 1008]|uniref:hypothetical protein n=1 Tax=Alcanivorax sp. 1008 TaxID=2816853 RepID=UPI001DFF1D87|nr:hypothetical protein [Alcanivorax sp. 1008]MCC1496757.1 hypothetical protein [Alcanivorax sp. 1008]